MEILHLTWDQETEEKSTRQHGVVDACESAPKVTSRSPNNGSDTRLSLLGRHAFWCHKGLDLSTSGLEQIWGMVAGTGSCVRQTPCLSYRRLLITPFASIWTAGTTHDSDLSMVKRDLPRLARKMGCYSCVRHGSGSGSLRSRISFPPFPPLFPYCRHQQTG